jgi:hypothetical protein
MSKDVHDAPASQMQPAPITLNGVIPRPVQLVCLVLLVVGAVILAVRPGYQESSAYNGMQNADAKIFSQKDKNGNPVTFEDGTSDMYGMIQFHNNDSDVGRYFTYCETNPAMALRLFRRALTEGTASARILAAYSGLFLAQRGVLESSDFELLRKSLDKAQPADVRKAAQRSLSDLTVANGVDTPGKYEELPADLPAPSSEEPARRIATHKETLLGKPVLSVRWSSAAVAAAWLNANATKGAWDSKLQRFVVP